MRKTLLSLAALAGLIGAAAPQAFATTLPAAPAPGLLQTVQYYYGGYDPQQAEWREREWRHREWERHHRWEEHRRYEEHHGW